MADPVASIEQSPAAVAARAALQDISFGAPVEVRRLLCCHFLRHADAALWPHVLTTKQALKQATDALRQAVVVGGAEPHPSFVAISIGTAIRLVHGSDAECKEADWQLDFAKQFLEERQVPRG